MANNAWNGHGALEPRMSLSDKERHAVLLAGFGYPSAGKVPHLKVPDEGRDERLRRDAVSRRWVRASRSSLMSFRWRKTVGFRARSAVRLSLPIPRPRAVIRCWFLDGSHGNVGLSRFVMACSPRGRMEGSTGRCASTERQAALAGRRGGQRPVSLASDDRACLRDRGGVSS